MPSFFGGFLQVGTCSKTGRNSQLGVQARTYLQVRIQTWLQVGLQVQVEAQIGEQSQVELKAKTCLQARRSTSDWWISHDGNRMKRDNGGKESTGTHQQHCN
jgi:hypothetical protein